MGWIAVDFDGTLVTWGEGHNHDVTKVGVPIPKMVDRVKEWLAEGKDVRIFTARVGHATREECELQGHPDLESFIAHQRLLIETWCEEHLGKVLPITCEKNFHMYELWDDRCVQVASNQGYTVMDVALEYSGKIHHLLTVHGLYGPEGYTFPDGDLWTPDPEKEGV